MKKHLVSYSGGLGSFAAAKLTIEKVGAENTLLVFTDTRTEDSDLYRFLRESSQHLAAPLHVLADGRHIWEVFRDVRFCGNSRIDPCSRVLKRELFRKWADKEYGPDNAVIVFGIDKKEAHRMTSIRERWAPYETSAPLTESGITREDILDWLDDAGIAAPRLYELGFEHNNCGGLCVKTGQKQMKLLLEKLPETYAWHEAEQEKTFKHIGSSHGFIRKTVDGELQYLSLKEFREHVQGGGQCELFNMAGCGCFV